MASLKIKETGVKTAIELTGKIPAKLDRQVSDVFQTVRDESKELMDGLTPVDTGYLLSQNYVEWTRSVLSQVLTVGNKARYAIYVAFGTRKMKARDFITPTL